MSSNAGLSAYKIEKLHEIENPCENFEASFQKLLQIGKNWQNLSPEEHQKYEEASKQESDTSAKLPEYREKIVLPVFSIGIDKVETPGQMLPPGGGSAGWGSLSSKTNTPFGKDSFNFDIDKDLDFDDGGFGFSSSMKLHQDISGFGRFNDAFSFGKSVPEDSGKSRYQRFDKMGGMRKNSKKGRFGQDNNLRFGRKNTFDNHANPDKNLPNLSWGESSGHAPTSNIFSNWNPIKRNETNNNSDKNNICMDFETGEKSLPKFSFEFQKHESQNDGDELKNDLDVEVREQLDDIINDVFPDATTEQIDDITDTIVYIINKEVDRKIKHINKNESNSTKPTSTFKPSFTSQFSPNDSQSEKKSDMKYCMKNENPNSSCHCSCCNHCSQACCCQQNPMPFFSFVPIIPLCPINPFMLSQQQQQQQSQSQSQPQNENNLFNSNNIEQIQQQQQQFYLQYYQQCLQYQQQYQQQFQQMYQQYKQMWDQPPPQ
ncbi:hypothetical protein TRFO_39905 [Tritrichomonas foetus]|uniref:Uncharacterized protein n=1 Tax=Tritrichomonas foetus TaxID=1144522 RepID=A0A1J4J3I9_9EUKA|nr:hypothetical protein TRFO_39905 [Tritrichomonas foetus]|eukprot:OHS93922.1 hypothetical protein TRFO_39905 [Tritrichomonas foetus]